eukprot:TRINITY_DN103400_c0_g1_i1.p1 TRINITY_DN103400_c0_g1~~TRINITY_DN103400_c0_g1_i1.p1  ORF type:complete len:381 (+),score=68.83 TRINITY_DN103400_c0_g1_i1:83-1225(+)
MIHIFLSPLLLLLLPMVATLRSCRRSGSEACGLEAMAGEPTMVYPGGQTRCIFSDAEEYSFQVLPGDRDKLLLFFQGGGACWNDASTNVAKPRPCVTRVVPATDQGIFDRAAASNPFRDYTVLHISYCSGDLHVGNVVRWYLDAQGRHVQQRGYQNALSALQWAQENFASSVLSSLLIMGSSTGALGAQLWAGLVLRTLRYSSAAVVADSYVGVFPPQSQGPLLESFGTCETGLLDGKVALQELCHAQNLTVQEVLDTTAGEFPHVAFAFLSSAHDRMQVQFYNAVSMASMLPQRTTQAEFYSQLTAVLASYDQHQNVVVYLMQGDQHYFLPDRRFFTAGLGGEASTPSTGLNPAVGPALAEWVASLPKIRSQGVSSQCA